MRDNHCDWYPMFSTCRKLYELLDRRERGRVLILLGLITMSGILDMVGIASILPFLAAVSNPEQARTNALLSRLYEWGGFTEDESFLTFLGIMVLCTVLLALASKILAAVAISRFSHMRNHTIGARLLGGYLRQPYVWFLNHHSSELGKTVLYETERSIMEAMLPAMRVFSNIASVVFLVVLLLFVQPWVALISAVVMGGAYVGIFYFVRRNLTSLGEKRAEDNAARYKIAQEVFGGLKDVKLMGLEETYLARFAVPSMRAATNASVSQVVGELPRHLLEVIAFGGMIVLILALLLTGSGEIGDILPTLGVFAFAGLRLFPAMQQIYLALTQMRFVEPLLDNVHRDTMLVGAPTHVPAPAAPVEPIRLQKSLEIRDVHYAYPNVENAALRGLSLEITANTTVGIVGGSGAGKTTAVDLILGLLPAQAGSLVIDGVPLAPSNMRAWQNSIGYVPQHIYLLDDSVAANIAFGHGEDDIDMARVERASRIANLHDFVMSELGQGYGTSVGERGIRLSGGQRQRIGIARALYNDPDVLIFDEATSALDNLTERAVMAAVNNLARSKTIIMIAHRLSTVRNCDLIFLLENGKLAAQGTFDELVSQNDSFRRMAEGVE
ncbi:MAG: ABC transporter ATP-binding protein [Paracoccaceae bacterium]